MARGSVIECPCGAVVEGTTEDEVVETAREHARSVHEMELSVDQARSMARPI
jgi:predicted small metal-binding protein